MVKNTLVTQQKMKKIYEEATAETHFENRFIYFEIMAFLVNRNYPTNEIREKLCEDHPNLHNKILDQAFEWGLKGLQRISYIQIIGSKNNILHATKRGLDAYLEIINRIEKLYKKPSRIRKGYQEHFDYNNYIDPSKILEYYPDVNGDPFLLRRLKELNTQRTCLDAL